MAYLGEMNDAIAKKKAEDDEGKKEPKTLWDMFMEYMKDKEKMQDKKLVDVL
jgi:hypothetical protein